jgi:hypothetical protein
VDPDQVARLIMLCYDCGESLVYLGVRLPIAYMERNLIQQIMEERPEDSVGEAFVVPGHLSRAQGDRY